MAEDGTKGLLLRGAEVIDGTGSPAQRVDVAVAGDRIVGVGPDLDLDFAEVDLSGLVLSPGFVDPHTHYDAQIFWDGDLTPSSWHGVTSVVMGNCGFSIAPTRPDHQDVVVRTLENVEGMSVDTLRAGLPWGFETFPEYLNAVDAQPKRLNVSCIVGHTALRWYVLGDDAPDRQSTDVEVERMCALLREAFAHGAVGLSTSMHNHIGAFGKPVPSRAASRDEFAALGRTLGEVGRGTIEIAIGDWFGVEETAWLSGLSGRPVTWSGMVLTPTLADDAREAAARAVDLCTGSGAAVVPQFPCRPIVNQVTLRDPFPLRSASPGFLEILQAEPDERFAMYSDSGWRDRARERMAPLWVDRLAQATVQETTVHTAIRNGPTLGELAAQQGTTVFDVLVDLGLADNLATRFKVAVANTDEGLIEQLLGDTRCMVGLSDGGAHVSQLCDANYATDLLGHWVRDRGIMPLELGVWRLTGQPAAVYGLHDRGRIAVGNAADLVAFDPDTVGTGPIERVWDFPGNADRLIARSTGIEHVWVNGTRIRSSGADVPDVTPGKLLRGAARGRDN